MNTTATPDLPFDSDGDPDSQAQDWVIYLYSGNETEAGIGQFSAWLASSHKHPPAYRRAEQLWRDFGYSNGAEPELAELDTCTPAAPVTTAAISPISNPAKRTTFYALAASFLLAVAALGLWRFALHTPEPTLTYASKTAEIKTVQLADGSEVTLAADSAFTFTSSANHRHVHLTRGGAYFDVAHNADKPFTVRADAAEIRVLGTTFDIQKRPSSVQVSVSEGSVEVSDRAHSQPERLQSSPARIRLTAGQQVSVAWSSGISAVRSSNGAMPAWRKGLLIYVNDRLDDVIAEVNRYRDQKIILAQPSLGDIRVTIALPLKHTDRLLSALPVTESVIITQLPEAVLIRKKN